MLSLRQQVVRGVLWTGAQKLLVRVTTLLAFVVVSRELAPADVGLVALAMALVVLLSVLADLGVASYLVQCESVTRRVVSTALWASVALGGLLAAAVLLAAPVLADALDAPRLTGVLRWLSLLVVAAGVAGVQSALLERELQFRPLALRQLLAAGAGAAVAVVLALVGAGVWSLVAQALVTQVVLVVALWRASPWQPALELDRAELSLMLGFGSKVLGMNLLAQVRDRAEDLALAAVAGPGALGSWTVAKKVLLLVLEVCVSVVSVVATPAFSRVRTDRRRLVRAFEQALCLCALAAFPVLTALVVLGDRLVPVVFGEQWETSGRLTQVFAATAVLGLLVVFDRPLYVAIGRPGVELGLLAVVIGSHLVAVALCARHGLMVLAVALAARVVLTAPLRLYVLRRVVGVPIRTYLHLLPVVAACALAAGAMLLAGALLPGATDAVVLLLQACAGAGAYGLGIALLARQQLDAARRDLRDLQARRRGGVPA